MPMDCYKERNLILRGIGFASYADYLASDLWKGIRRRVLALHGKCSRCRKKASRVHHTAYDYDTMAGINLTKLRAVCNHCHEQAEFKENGQKSTLQEANVRLSTKRIKSEPRTKMQRKKKRPASFCSCGRVKGPNQAKCVKCLRNDSRERHYAWRGGKLP